MKPTKEELLTRKSYDQHAQEWAKAHRSPGYWTKEMSEFREFLPQGRIIEIGSGSGRDARELIAAGYDYTGTDISKGLVKEAQKYNLRAKFVHSSIYDLNFPDNSFDGFWASAVLLHVPKSRIGKALHVLHKLTRPKGVGFISIKRGGGEHITFEEGHSRIKLTRLFSFYSDKEFKAVLQKGRFQILDSKPKQDGNTTWLIYFVSPIKG